ncbi:class I SAM-dependent methyltransferase [Akkermansiaceae bacterium]|nr:class I SAM-dependent methyltransferase [Akkermansiaceae bacterium]
MLRKLLPGGSVKILGSVPEVSGGAFGMLCRFTPFRWMCGLIERIALPGIAAHYLARKAWIEREVRNALADGLRRVLVIGAGFDPLAARLSSEYPEVDFIELDHPATQKEKARSLFSGNNLHLLGVDLGHESPLGAFREAGPVAEPAMVVAEGLTMYLREERVIRLLRDAAILAGDGGRVLFSFMERRDDGSIGFQGQSAWVRRWLDACGESFLWGMELTRIGSFLAKCGLAPSEMAGAEILRRDVLKPNGLHALRLAQGEWLCLATPKRP